jgi:hypothetical protein
LTAAFRAKAGAPAKTAVLKDFLLNDDWQRKLIDQEVKA